MQKKFFCHFLFFDKFSCKIVWIFNGYHSNIKCEIWIFCRLLILQATVELESLKLKILKNFRADSAHENLFVYLITYNQLRIWGFIRDSRSGKIKIALKMQKNVINCKNFFCLGRLSAPGGGGFCNFRKEKNTKPIIFRACNIKFSSPKFFNSGSPNLLKVLIMDVWNYLFIWMAHM